VSEPKKQKECSYCGRKYTESGLGCYEKRNNRHFCSPYHARLFYLAEQGDSLREISIDIKLFIANVNNQ